MCQSVVTISSNNSKQRYQLCWVSFIHYFYCSFVWTFIFLSQVDLAGQDSATSCGCVCWWKTALVETREWLFIALAVLLSLPSFMSPQAWLCHPLQWLGRFTTPKSSFSFAATQEDKASTKPWAAVAEEKPYWLELRSSVPLLSAFSSLLPPPSDWGAMAPRASSRLGFPFAASDSFRGMARAFSLFCSSAVASLSRTHSSLLGLQPEDRQTVSPIPLGPASASRPGWGMEGSAFLL